MADTSVMMSACLFRRALRATATLLMACAALAPTIGLTPAPPANYSLPIVDSTGLAAGSHTVYVVGYSVASLQQLQFTGDTGTFVAYTQASGTLPVYTLTASPSSLSLPSDVAITGARVYFFVDTAGLGPPAISYSGSGASVTQPGNPPNSTVPPYSFVEITVPTASGLPTIDIQTVDGFVFPLSITLNDSLGQVGQPTTVGSSVTRTSILAAYAPFMTALGTIGDPYQKLKFSQDGGGLLNPFTYLQAQTSTGELTNLGSSLNDVFDAEVDTLFANPHLSIQGVSSGPIPAQTYTVSAYGYAMYPGASVPHMALQLSGSAGDDFKVFNPVGMTVMNAVQNGVRAPIYGTINGTTLHFSAPLPANSLRPGLFVNGAGTDPNTTAIQNVQVGPLGVIVGVVLNQNLGHPAPNSQYLFSIAPGLYQTSGAMVFGNSGVFADSHVQESNADRQTVLANIENQLVSALNRGVANLGPTSGAAGYSSAYWGTETYWYPSTTTQNLFSLFMHTGVVTVDGISTPIFLQNNPVNCARNVAMGQAYGFAFDENPGPVPPAPNGQPEVPSKFDPVPENTTTMTITLGAWGGQTSGAQVVNGSVVVVGTEGDDVIRVVFVNRGKFLVRMNSAEYGPFDMTTTEVVIYGLEGHDQIRVDGRIPVRAVIDGGPGNDRIWGGGGADSLVGGDGDDSLFGRGGLDELFGGGGRNRLRQ